MATVDNVMTEKKQKKAKKKMLIVLLSIAGIMAVLAVAALLIDMIENNNDAEKITEKVIDYNFYPADYDENIYEDEEYIERIAGGLLRFCDSETNITLGFTKESAAAHGNEVVFLTDMIYDIINGESDSYNSKFSNEYYKTHERKNSFTMQKLYDVTITYISKEQVTDNGNYTKYCYIVEYKIYHNNGTFRKDIGDGSARQYFILSDRGGQLLIDNVS